MNMNHWIRQEKNDELLFRFAGDDVRAVFIKRYVPTDNIEVLEKIHPSDMIPKRESIAAWMRISCH